MDYYIGFNDTLFVILVWVHFAFVFVPVIGLVGYVEYVDWRERHQKEMTTRPQKLILHWPFRPQPL